MRYINRHVPIINVARTLDLRLNGASKIHCWHSDRHKNDDRTASVGIRGTNNTVKCFGCDFKPLGPIDLVMDVLGVAAGDAALWIAENFKVPSIPAGKRLAEEDRWRGPAGHDRGMQLLVRSGLFGSLSEATRSIALVLLEMSDKVKPTDQESSVQISYRAITRYSGVHSPNAISKALLELGEIGFLRFPDAGLRRSPNRPASNYIVTPNSDELYELAQVFATQMKTEIAAERELRDRLRREKTRAWRERSVAQVSTLSGGAKSRPLTSYPLPRLREDQTTNRCPLY